MDKKVGFVLFENFWQRKDIGSSRIRGHWLIKNMPEAEIFQQGKEYDTLIFQKVYWKEMARSFKGKKILDICDPDWMDGAEIVGFLKEMDAVTVPTEYFKEKISKFTDKPIYVIPDRIDMEIMPKPKEHKGRAKKVVWFGYSQNLDVLDPTLMKLKKLNLTLKIISDGSYSTRECKTEFIRWHPETWMDEIQEADFCLLPEKLSGRSLFKSPNKTHQAWLLGMPVAKTPQELERFINEEERKEEAEDKYKWAVNNCDVKLSVAEMRDVINSITK